VPAAEKRQIDQLIADLDSPVFDVRRKATAAMTRLDWSAEPVLRQVLARKPSLEVRRRVEALLARLEAPITSPESLRALRAVAVLEYIGNPAARQVLQTLAGGAAEARLTQEARASLDRLARRPAAQE
jgi:hypothetical protein